MIPSHGPDSRARADELGESREIRLSVPTKLNAPPVFTSSNELRVIGRAQRGNMLECRAITNICTLLYSTKPVHCVWCLGMS